MAKRLGLLVAQWENFGITMQYIYIYICILPLVCTMQDSSYKE